MLHTTSIRSLALGLLFLSHPAGADWREVGSIEIPSEYGGWSLSVVDGVAYVTTDLGVHIIDVSDPSDPEQLGLFSASEVWHVFVVGNLAYVASASRGLQVVDVSNPAAPLPLGSVETPGEALRVSVVGGFAYVADRTEGLRVIDIRDSAAPVEVGSVEMSVWNRTADVSVLGGYAYVAGGTQEGASVVDVSDPTAPELLETVGQQARRMAVVGSFAYVAVDEGLRVLDVSEPSAPVEVGSFNATTPLSGYAVTAVGSFAYLSDLDRGVRVIDVSDPTAPVQVGFIDLFDPRDVSVVGGVVYIADQKVGLRIYRESAPAPVALGSIDALGDVQSVSVVSDHAFLAAGDSGLRVVDLADSLGPFEAWAIDTPGEAHDAVSVGGLTYVADGSSGLRVIANQVVPEVVGVIDLTGVPGGLAVESQYAYVAAGDSGFLVFDVSDPSGPVEVGRLDEANAWDVAVADGFAYVERRSDTGGGWAACASSTSRIPRSPSRSAGSRPDSRPSRLRATTSTRCVASSMSAIQPTRPRSGPAPAGPSTLGQADRSWLSSARSSTC